MVLVLMARPLPEHVSHGSSTTRPRPRQVRHGSENAKLPRFRLPCPVPSQVGQTRGTVPALAPVPLHTGHAPSPVSRRGTVVPLMASTKDSVVSVSTSAPRRGLLRLVVVPPPRLPKPPPVPDPDPGIRIPPPNRERASSYSFRRFSSDSTV